MSCHALTGTIQQSSISIAAQIKIVVDSLTEPPFLVLNLYVYKEIIR
jgi:hypothetical protein